MTTTVADPDDNGEKILEEASDIIESEQANVLIEIEMMKAIRVGLLLRSFRGMMTDPEGSGAAFPEDWVDHAAMDIFHKFFPPPIDMERTYYGEPDDVDD
jgi:DNA-binding transcriptional regulator PaaX